MCRVSTLVVLQQKATNYRQILLNSNNMKKLLKTHYTPSLKPHYLSPSLMKNVVL